MLDVENFKSKKKIIQISSGVQTNGDGLKVKITKS